MAVLLEGPVSLGTIRSHAGWTQGEFAKLARVSRHVIVNAEEGKRIRLSTAALILDAARRVVPSLTLSDLKLLIAGEKGLQYYRILAHYSLPDLAGSIGVSASTLKKMEDGQQIIPLPRAQDILTILNAARYRVGDAPLGLADLHLRIIPSPPRRFTGNLLESRREKVWPR